MFKEKKQEDIESSLIKQLNSYPWGNLFTDTSKGILSTILPWLNLIASIAILFLIWKKI